MSATPEPRTRDRAAGGAGEPPGAPQKKSGIRRSVSYDAGVGGPGGGGTAGMRRTQSGDGNSMPHTPEFPLELTRSSHFKCLTYMLEHVASDDEGDGVARCTSSAAPSVASSQDHGLSASRGSDKSHMLVPVGRPSSFASGTHSQASIAPADALAPRGLASPSPFARTLSWRSQERSRRETQGEREEGREGEGEGGGEGEGAGEGEGEGDGE